MQHTRYSACARTGVALLLTVAYCTVEALHEVTHPEILHCRALFGRSIRFGTTDGRMYHLRFFFFVANIMKHAKIIIGTDRERDAT